MKADLPQPWRDYARLQSELSRRFTIDDHAWGVEAGLDRYLLDDPAVAPQSAAEIARTRSAGARRERSRVHWRAENLMPFIDIKSDPEIRLAARRDLSAVQVRTTPEEWALLFGVAIGHEYADLATGRGTTPGALRLAVLRLRSRLRSSLTIWALPTVSPRRFAVGPTGTAA